MTLTHFIFSSQLKPTGAFGAVDIHSPGELGGSILDTRHFNIQRSTLREREIAEIHAKYSEAGGKAGAKINGS